MAAHSSRLSDFLCLQLAYPIFELLHLRITDQRLVESLQEFVADARSWKAVSNNFFWIHNALSMERVMAYERTYRPPAFVHLNGDELPFLRLRSEGVSTIG